ncbi:AraC family transcriptional regulator [Aliarcobacter butzleri]|jgi:AraC family transcriptional regulator|uniref:AraC family transcriptional regulator n=1 Tax=Arcobacteraceae TaxID=2808963 RepID=UPI001EDBCF18|nr:MULTISPECIES: AraC family transcriptional regulator [Arcobacteraceae]MCG3656369.1 AraC family transcriptional regulator [Aliarcobacter butzleri]MCG3685576.1 AraC family transcriptional regulator [Aliarcobacter butzleri]MCT7537679.1 AraC family transcriptional regulator [Aliarcobacter butzleri]MCT7624031.1 AraC family transcriptional regulator [Aliarcobacter butzleri]MCT7910967.1 AraC family transcriptional regulator [Arcobacter lacus]
MKRVTFEKRAKISNDVMNYIYEYIDTDINIDELCLTLKISKFHLHRIFKEEFGKNIYESIKSIRLQKAANLLITNKYSTITDISKMTGYSSQTSFLRSFKQRFLMTPKEWKNGGYKEYSNKIVEKISTNSQTIDFSNIEPSIVKMPEIKGYYIRHKGYDKSIKKTWQKLQTWIYTNDIKEYKQMALHHDNPIITPLEDCQYIAIVVLEDKEKASQDFLLPSLIIPKGIYAKFSLSGKYGDVIKLIQWVYHTWLIKSGYETTPSPSYTIYHKNHFLSDDGEFILDYYLPIRYV